MSYTIENNDIVMKGFEEGILDDPYNGIFDMRNIDSVTVPGEASIAFKNTATSIENGGTVSGETVTANYTTNVITHDGSETLTVNQKIYFYTDDVGKTVFGNVTAGKVYYVRTVPTSTTFTISATPGGSEVDLTDPSTNTLTSGGGGSGSITAVTTRTITISGLTDVNNIGKYYTLITKTTVGYTTAITNGWTKLAENTDGTYYYTLYGVLVDGNQVDDTTVTWASAVTGRYQYTQNYSNFAFATTPVKTITNTVYTTNNTSIECAGITTTTANSIILAIGLEGSGGTDSTLWTKPVDIGADAFTLFSSDSGSTFDWASYQLTKRTTGATGTVTITMNASSTTKHGWLLEFPFSEIGTVKMSSINMSTPKVLYTGLTATNEYMYFCIDSNGRLWIRDTNISYLGGTNVWLYMNNLASGSPSGVSGMCLWKDYIFVFSSNGVAYTQVAAFATMFAGWDYTWQGALNADVNHHALVSQDDNIYFLNGSSIGRIVEEPNLTFDPTDATTYTYTGNVLTIADGDRAVCMTEFGSDILIGGSKNIIYPWNRIDFNYNSVIRLSENYVSRIVTINTTAYIFAGYKGRIYVSNGGNATPYYKMPEYLANTTNPYIIWQDATYNNNQLYFSLTATTNSGTTINEYSGVWGINVDTASPSQPRLNNLLSYGTYTGYPTCFTQNRGLTFASIPSADGYGLYTGWVNSSTVGIDVGSSTPFTGGEPYVVFQPIPVGTFKTKKTFQNLEYKLSTPLVAGESVTLQYRTNITEAFTTVPVTSGGATGDLSGLCDTVNFENVQWVQIKAILNGTASSPSYVRLREVRLR